MADRAQKRIDLEQELGLSRRDLLRRGAIVGGTLLWAAPAVQSIARPAYANVVQGSARYYCCYCWRPTKQHSTACTCAVNGAPPLVPNNDADCAALCRSQGFPNHDFDSGLHSCSCNTDPCTTCNCN